MSSEELSNYLNQLESNYRDSSSMKDKQSLFYFMQMSDLLYNELKNEFYDQVLLYDFVHNIFKKNITIIFDNMSKYSEKVSLESIKSFNELVKISVSNKYIDINGLNALYNNFKNEVIKNMSIDDKINTLVNSNTDSFKGQLFSRCIVNDSDKASSIIDKYNGVFTEEFIKNIHSKRDLLVELYKGFIDSILSDLYEQKDVVDSKNLKLIVNTAYNYLKEREYINIDKYSDSNIKFINECFDNIEEKLYSKFGVKRVKSGNINPVKDYFIGFNNTIRIKSKNIFDEMNLIVTLDKEKVNEKINEFNDLISRIYEVKLVFDKQLVKYKSEFSFVSKDNDEFNEMLKKEFQRLNDGIKANISNIFRDNIKIYNDVVYRTLLLKSRINEYNTVLSCDKVKDLLFK